MITWLVRTAKNVVTGPLVEGELRRMIEEGKLSLEDEVCGANQYWFTLRETEELRRQLGVDSVPLPLAQDETQQIEPDLERTDKVMPIRGEPTRVEPLPESQVLLEPTRESPRVWRVLIGLFAVLAAAALVFVIWLLNQPS